MNLFDKLYTLYPRLSNSSAFVGVFQFGAKLQSRPIFAYFKPFPPSNSPRGGKDTTLRRSASLPPWGAFMSVFFITNVTDLGDCAIVNDVMRQSNILGNSTLNGTVTLEALGGFFLLD